MKTGLHSRTNVLHLSSALAAVVFGLAAAFAPGKVSSELAASIASLMLLLFAGAGGYLKADDRKKVDKLKADTIQALADVGAVAVGELVKVGEVTITRKPTAGDLVNAKAAKAAGKLGVGMALALLCGCGPTWQLCEVDLSNHPVKPRPAASARVRCSRTVLCDVAEGAKCDGEVLAKGAK